MITDEALDRLRKKIGIEVGDRPDDPPPFDSASKNVIRGYAFGSGDDNPLWVDEEYARKSHYEGIIAPPLFPEAMAGPKTRLWHLTGLPGIQAIYAGNDWEFFEPVRANDRITVTAKLTGVTEKEGRFAKRMILEEAQSYFRNQHGRTVAILSERAWRVERSAAKEKSKYADVTRAHYTEADRQAIWEDYRKEERRGANPRYWEDVEVGSDMTPVVKGPLTVTDEIAFIMGMGDTQIKAHRLAWEFYHKNPGYPVPDSFGVPDTPFRQHWDDGYVQKMGIPIAYDMGPQRLAWLAHLVTNWMGDDGILKKLLGSRLIRLNFIGDTTWCKGRVTSKYIENGDHLVACDIWAENQRHETTATVQAIISLPSRAKEVLP